MDVFITGATGYIGAAVSTHLVREGHTVTGLTRDASSSAARTLNDVGIRMVSGDFGDPATYREHLAAAHVVVHTVVDSKRPVDADRDLFSHLIAESSSGTGPHLIYTTGCSVYGAHSQAVLTEETPIDAGHPRAKLENELRLSGLPHTIVRPAFVFGGDGRSSLLGRWLDTGHEKAGVFYGDLAKKWSWVHVDDLARGYAAIIQRLQELDGATFLFADDEAFPALDTFQAAHAVVHPDGPITFAPIEGEDELYRIFDRDEVVDARKARDRLEWAARKENVTAFVQSKAVSRPGHIGQPPAESR